MALSAASVVASSSFLIFTEIIILAGNTLVILAVCRNKPMQTVTNIFIVNLSITDLFVAIFNCPLMLLAVLADGWIIGDVMCKISGFLNVVFCCASILTLTAISIDRYYCIIHPTKKIITRHKAFLMIASIWFVVILFAMMPLVGWNDYVYIDARKHCMIYWQRGGADSAYGAFLSFSSFVIPTWIMIFCYYKIFSTAKTHAKKVDGSRGYHNVGADNRQKARLSKNTVVPIKHGKTDTTITLDDSASSNVDNNALVLESIATDDNIEEVNVNQEHSSPSFDQERNHSLKQEASDNNEQRKKCSNATAAVSRNVKERRTARVILIVIGVFQICWFPYAALNQWSAYTGRTPPGIADFGASLLAYFNSGCNAIIYTKFNPKFRTAFAKMLCCGSGKKTKTRINTKRIQVNIKCKK